MVDVNTQLANTSKITLVFGPMTIKDELRFKTDVRQGFQHSAFMVIKRSPKTSLLYHYISEVGYLYGKWNSLFLFPCSIRVAYSLLLRRMRTLWCVSIKR